MGGPLLQVHVEMLNAVKMCLRRSNCSESSKHQPTHSLRRSAYPHQPFVDTVYVAVLRRSSLTLVLTGTRMTVFLLQVFLKSSFPIQRTAPRIFFLFFSFFYSDILCSMPKRLGGLWRRTKRQSLMALKYMQWISVFNSQRCISRLSATKLVKAILKIVKVQYFLL